MDSSGVYINILIATSIIGGVINLYQLISFIKQCKLRFLSSRNPILIIVYCMISLLISLIICPVGLYYHNVTDCIFFNKFSIEFFDELCHAMLYVIILCRAWLLFYDYKFSECSSNKIWRNVIDPNDNNFWLTHRKTFGNLHFLICIALIITSLSLICLSFIGSIALKQEDTIILHYFTLFGLGIPFYSFLIYLIMYKIKLINDIYLIHRELKYLSLCIIIRIIAFIIDLIIHSYDNYLFFYTMEVLSTFLSVWIQCQWVLNQLKKQENKKDLQQYQNMDGNDKNNKNNKDKKNKYSSIKMIDIFDDKTSFEIFIKHCIHELSVESILFLIEISQFKATLYKFNAFGIEPIKYRYIDVNNTNFIEYIKQIREQKEESPKEEEDVIPSPLPLNMTHFSSSEHDDNRLILNLHLSPQLISESSAINITGCTSSPHSEQNEQKIPDPLQKVETLQRVDTLSRTVSIRSPSTMITSIRQEAEFKQFQDNILKKKWIPIAMPLKLLSNHNSMTPKEIKEKSEKSQKSQIQTNNIDTKSSPKSKVDSKSCTNNHIEPISIAVITADIKEEEEEEEEEDIVDDDDDDDDDDEEIMHIDINWMYEYGRHLYLKYVDNSADLAINVPYQIRKDLWSVYSKELNVEAFQKIHLLHHEYLSQIDNYEQGLTSNENVLFIQTYLYHSFDVAFHSIWTLLTSDTYHRFKRNKQFKILCQQRDIQKLEEARFKRNSEYSHSFQDNQYNM